MTPAVFAAFDTLCRRLGAAGCVLEIGAMVADDTLLNLPALRSCESRIGINVERAGALGGGEILHGNANDLDRKSVV
mgnify:CR=1 FL=1